MTDEATTDLTAVLVKHYPLLNRAHCHCGWKATVDERRFQPGFVGVEGQWLAHMAEVLAPVIRAERAAALDEAARETLASPSTRLGDRHPGEVWAEWLTARAEAERRGES